MIRSRWSSASAAICSPSSEIVARLSPRLSPRVRRPQALRQRGRRDAFLTEVGDGTADARGEAQGARLHGHAAIILHARPPLVAGTRACITGAH
jgi:hypothetical protein